jgi:8-oxo-dGTP diphosphatase
MTAYVCGFAFDHLQRVVLLRKTKPKWQAGLLNGLGGKIDDIDIPAEHKAASEIMDLPVNMLTGSRNAMAREFKEECGLDISPARWVRFHREQWPNSNVVEFFACQLNEFNEVPTSTTEEEIIVLRWRHATPLELAERQMMYNLPYLIPMAYCHLNGDPGNLPYHALTQAS